MTSEGLRQYDDLPAEEAVLRAWAEPGNNPPYHRLMKERVRAEMPVLARALDRMVE